MDITEESLDSADALKIEGFRPFSKFPSSLIHYGFIRDHVLHKMNFILSNLKKEPVETRKHIQNVRCGYPKHSLDFGLSVSKKIRVKRRVLLKICKKIFLIKKKL